MIQSSYYGLDLLRNTRILVSSGGVITDSYTYRAFGEDAGTSGTIVNPFRFGGLVGYYYDGVNREYIRSRHYKSELGRWSSQDPIGYLGGDVNLYRFVGNEPTGWSDALGLWESGSYIGDVWSFFKGEMSALNPLNMAHGIGSAYDFMSQQGWTNGKAWGQLGSGIVNGFVNGIQFWNQPDMESAGQSFMGDVLLISPVLKGIPLRFARYGEIAGLSPALRALRQTRAGQALSCTWNKNVKNPLINAMGEGKDLEWLAPLVGRMRGYPIFDAIPPPRTGQTLYRLFDSESGSGALGGSYTPLNPMEAPSGYNFPEMMGLPETNNAGMITVAEIVDPSAFQVRYGLPWRGHWGGYPEYVLKKGVDANAVLKNIVTFPRPK